MSAEWLCAALLQLQPAQHDAVTRAPIRCPRVRALRQAVICKFRACRV